MIVCLCNGISERSICAQRDAGACTPEEVFASLDCEARCATCIPEIEALLDPSPRERTEAA
jgi:bacterioferritin-associated ferredoxin